jgi:catechol 2,3-dioxygenase
VRLQVADLGRSLDFYRETLGLRELARDASSAALGAAGEDVPALVELHEHRGASPAPRRGRLGLFHFAILLPDRPSLGRFVVHLGEIGAQAGAGDHLVSESFYLQDPDNLGIEVYADRPRESWRRIGRELMMATDPVDVPDLLRAAGSEPWSGLPAGTRMGHVHLHVGALDGAASFYSEALGFDRTVWEYPGALFLAAGGYHHHLGTNLWAGPGATAPPADEAQLLEWTLELPDEASLTAVAESLARAGQVAGREGSTLLTRDPWGTPLRLRRGTNEGLARK